MAVQPSESPASTPVAGSRLWSTARREHFIQYGVWLLTILLLISPLIPILIASLRDRPLYEDGGVYTLDNYVRLFNNADFYQAVINTMYFATLTTIFSVVVGTTMAVLIGRTDLPFKRLFSELILVPLYLPPLTLAIAWLTMYAPSGYVSVWVSRQLELPVWDLYTIPGMALVAMVIGSPIVYLYVSGAVALADPLLENAARSAGASPLHVLRTITIPMLRPSILSSALLVFVISVEVLGIPLILGTSKGIDFIVSFLYNETINRTPADYGLVSAGAVVFVLTITILVLGRNRLLGDASRFVSVGGRASRPNMFPLGSRLRWVLAALVGLYFFLFIGLPMIGLLLTAFVRILTPLRPFWEMWTLQHFEQIFNSAIYVRSFQNSMIIALVGGLITTAFVAVVALVAHRSNFRFRQSMDFLALYPRTIPGLVIGLGFFWALVIVQPLGGIRNTIIGVMVAFMVRNLALAYGAVAPVLASISNELDDAARTAGASWWTACRTILLRLMRPALFSSFILMFITLLKEYDPAVFLVAPGSEVIGLTMLQFAQQGFIGPVAALAVTQTLVIIVVVTLARLFFKVRIYG